MAYLFKRGSVYYVKFYVAGKQKEKSLGTGVYQIAKEKQRLFESARARGESLPMPTRTPIAEIVTAYVAAIRTAKTAKSAQTDIYYLRDVFGPICDALKITSRKASEKTRKRQLKEDVDRRHKAPVIEADCFEAITTAQIVEFVSGQVARRGLAPKTANRYREILTRLFNWAVEQKGVRLPGDRNPASKVERYRESAPNIRFLTLKQIDEQLGALAENLKLQAMVATLIFAGLRREELLWLTHDDLDLDAGKHGLIRVRAKEIHGESWEPKTKKNEEPLVARYKQKLPKEELLRLEATRQRREAREQLLNLAQNNLPLLQIRDDVRASLVADDNKFEALFCAIAAYAKSRGLARRFPSDDLPREVAEVEGFVFTVQWSCVAAACQRGIR